MRVNRENGESDMDATATATTRTATAATTIAPTMTANTTTAETTGAAIGTGGSVAGRAWSLVATSLETLAAGPRQRRRERGATPVTGEDAADPIHHLTLKLTGAIDATGPAGRTGAAHPAVGLRIGQVAAALEQALRETAQAIPPLGRHAAGPGATAREDSEAAGDDDSSMELFAGPHSRLVVTTVPPGRATDADRHEADRLVLLLDGAGECVVDGLARMFSGTDAQCVPAGAQHAVRNTGDATMHIATVYAPAVNSAV